MSIALDFGDTLTGLLVGGVDGAHFVGATFRLDDRRGILVEVPYVRNLDSDQFRHVEKWFASRKPPKNLQLMTESGTLALFDVTFGGDKRGHFPHRVSLGRLYPGEVVLHGRDGELQDELVLETARSRLDGLNEWAQSSAISVEDTCDEAGKLFSLTIDLAESTVATWQQQDATLALRSTWQTIEESEKAGRLMKILDHIVVETSYATGPRPFRDHLAEQRKVAALITMAYGRAARFRKHLVRDGRFAAKALSGRVVEHPFVELVSSSTVRDRLHLEASDGQGHAPIAFLSDVGAAGLWQWAENYDKWRRFILPVVAAFGRRDTYLEEVVSLTCMGMEAAGQLIGEREGERVTYGRNRKPTMATYVYRCLDLIEVDWGPAVESTTGLARAIARNYNAIKHADRGDYPDYIETYILREVNLFVVRLIALQLAIGSEGAKDSLLSRGGAWRERQMFAQNGTSIAAGGMWEKGKSI